VSLLEINTAAGQRNATALQYHFADRRGLLAAVLAKHHATVDPHRHALLDEYERDGRDDLRILTGALVRPFAAKLGDSDGGRDFLRIYADVVNVPDRHFGESAPGTPGNSVDRWRKSVAPLLSDLAVRRLHHRFTAIRVTATELARRAASARRRDDQLFTSHLVDLVTTLLTTPISEETAGLLSGNRAAPQPAVQ
jgi:AcrR family transcriptional regulator